MTMTDTVFLIAYENSERRLAFYGEHGFPWWSYDPANGTKYLSRDRAEKLADQLRSQRKRSGPIRVVTHTEAHGQPA
jgi:hypothetical protein